MFVCVDALLHSQQCIKHVKTFSCHPGSAGNYKSVKIFQACKELKLPECTNRMNMGIYYFSYASSEEIPKHHSSIIAANSEEGSMSVESTGDSNTDTV